MVNAADVQRAFTNNFDIAGVLQANAQQQQRNEQLNFMRQEKADRDFYNTQKYIEDKFSIGTGTPIDRVTNETVAKAQADLFEALKKNKGRLSQAQMMGIISPHLSGLQAKQQAAKNIRSEMERKRTSFDKDHPELDWNKFFPEALKNAFYDESGQIKQELNPEAFSQFYNQVLENPDVYDQFVNERQLNELVQKNLKNLPALDVSVPLPGFKEVFREGKRMPYEIVDPKTGVKSVAFEPVDFKGKQFKALPEPEAEVLLSIPEVQTAARIKARQMDPEIPMETRMRIAARDVAETFGKSEGQLKINKDQWAMSRMMQNDARNEAHRRTMESHSAQRLQLSKERESRIKKDTEKYADYFSKALKGDKSALGGAVKVELPAFKPFEGKEVFDITASLPGDGFIPAKDGSGDKIKVYSDGVNAATQRYKLDPITKELVPGEIKKLSDNQKNNLIKTAKPSLKAKMVETEEVDEPIQIQIDSEDLSKIFD